MLRKGIAAIIFALFLTATFSRAADGAMELAWAFTGASMRSLMPGPPTNVVATAGNGEATVSFDPPKSDGGSPIIRYTVTSHPGNIRASGKQSPITVRGLTNGTTYTFTVTAGNSVGTAPGSEARNSVTPKAQ